MRRRISPADVDKLVLCHRPNSHCVGRYGLATRIGRGIAAYGWRLEVSHPPDTKDSIQGGQGIHHR